MKLKELKRTVNMGWSPSEALLVAGSAAQQVDSSFSSTSQLEVYALNWEDPGVDLELKSSLQTQHKFHKLVWSSAGVIIGGCDGGLLEFYNADKLLKSSSDALIGNSTKHNGHVSALDINPYQKNLLASGASDSEIFIWDLNNTAQPMAPGNRSQPYDHVQGLSWNQQVQHILGSTFATRCVVWDLRKNEPIMKLSDSTSRTRWRSLAWHPSVATQVCIASEDDQAPVVQLWDLRLAASPLLVLEGHQKGVMAVSWCKQDSDLLLSAGRDGRILCWNPNNTQPGGELVLEVSQQREWVFDVSWSPSVPGVLASTSFDQQLAVHTLLPIDRPEVTSASQSTILDSFGQLSQLPVVQREGPGAKPAKRPPQPARAPAWLRRPVAAKFAFGGKLVMFDRCPQEAGVQKQVYISQVVSEPEIVERAAQLDAVLGSSLSQDPQATEQLAEYCRARGDAASDQNERYTWFFLRANFLPTFRTEVLNLLGFKQDEIPSKFKSSTSGDHAQPNLAALSRGESTETEAELSTDTSTDLSDAQTLIERKLANVDLGTSVTNVVIPNGEDQTSLICRALVCGNLEEAVELCLDAKRIADALIIASLGSQELLYKVQKYHLQLSASDPVSLVAGSLLQSRWEALVRAAAPASWRDALAALVTHCEGEMLAHYCEMLGEKLSAESDPALNEAAVICYLCAMSPEPLVSRWAKCGRSAAALAGLTERVLLARRAAAARGRHLQTAGKLEAVLNEYAWRLAAQGCLQSALNTLEGVVQTELRDRLVKALGLYQEQRRASQQPSQFTRNRSASSHSNKRGHHVAHNDNAAPYGGGGNIYQPQQPWQPAVPEVPPHNYQPPHQPLQPPQPLQPLQPLQPALQPSQQPPRPSSSGPGSGIGGRSKYKVDPSVAAAPLYNQYSFNNPVQAQPYGNLNSPLPEQYSASSVPSSGYGNNPVNPGMNPINSTPLNPLNNPMNPLNPAPLNPTLNPVGSIPDPYRPPMDPYAATNGGLYNQEAAAPVKPAAPGWNDPPMVTSKPKQAGEMSALHAGTRQWSSIIEHRRQLDESKPEAVQPQAPITHPLFGVEPPQHIPLVPNNQYQAQQFQGQYGQMQGYPGQQQAQVYPDQQNPLQPPPQSYPGQQQYPGQYPGQQVPGAYSDVMNPGYQQGRESPAVQAAPAPAPVKQPIPDQYLPMTSVFDSLGNECINRANNPQMKRKLEDVQRRLETLYDMLREHRLSEGALTTLDSCASLARAGQLAGAAAAATSLAAGTEFAAVASFLPALKMLLQMSLQLQVQLN